MVHAYLNEKTCVELFLHIYHRISVELQLKGQPSDCVFEGAVL